MEEKEQQVPSSLDLITKDLDVVAPKPRDIVTFDKVETAISSYQEFCYSRYVGKFSMSKPNKAPYRKDANPSFTYFYYNGKLLWKDHGRGEAGNLFQLVSKMFGLSIYDALIKVNEDFDLGFDHNRAKNKSYFSFNSNLQDTNMDLSEKKIKIKVSFRDFTPTDDFYWSRVGIKTKFLPSFGVYSIGAHEITARDNKTYRVFYEPDEIAYAYRLVYKEEEFFKLYFPLATPDKKWLNNIKADLMLGMGRFTTDRSLLIIAKSYKDAICLRHMGYNAVSPINETSLINETIINRLKEMFLKIVVFLDNDTAGLRTAQKYKDVYGLESIRMYHANSEYDPDLSKDITDFVTDYDFEAAKDMMKKILGEQLNF